MRKTKHLIAYQFHLFGRSNKWIMPLVIWVASMFVSYNVKPVNVGSSILVSGTTLFYIMLWTAISYYDSISPVAEQIILLKCGKRVRYDISQFGFLCLLTLLYALIGIFYPVIFNWYTGNDLYSRTLMGADIVASVVIHISFGLLGLALSILCQPRIMKNRKLAILLMACVAILAISRSGMIDSMHGLTYVLWILPPLSDLLTMLGRKDSFICSELLLTIGWVLIYDGVIVMLSEALLKQRNNY